MLVITRRENERTHILLPNGQTIIVTLVQVRTDKARLGFDAPKEIQIAREELLHMEE
jgi:carbon storage regulator CsrA